MLAVSLVLIIHGDYIDVVIHSGTGKTGINDHLTQLGKIILPEFLQFAEEEITKDPGSLVISLFTHFLLTVYLQETGGNFRTLQGEVIQFISQQGTAGRLVLVLAQLCISPSGEVFTHY